MSVTLNGYNLNVVGFSGGCSTLNTQYDAWDPTKLKVVHKTKIHVKLYEWTFTCIEDDVAWNDSAAKTLKALGDSVVSLESTLYVRPISPTNVKIVAVEILVDNEAQTLRRFSVSVEPT
jgi:hypothetical protein